MTNYRRVATKLAEVGPSYPDDLHPHFPELSREQLMDALKNARQAGLTRVHAKVKHPEKRGWIAKWEAGEHTEEPIDGAPLPPRGEYAWIGPVSSVWALGEAR